DDANDKDTKSDQEPLTAEPQTGTEPSEKMQEQARELASAAGTSPKALTVLTSESTFSTILGQLTLQRNETLSRIIQRVYGGYSSRYFKSFIMANPDIEDPDRVEVGQIVSLPAIPVAVKPPESPVWLVKVDEKDSLEAAYDILRNLPDNLPTVRLIPYWNPSDGTKFALILNKAFENEQAARSQLEKIPAAMSSNPTILSMWDKGTVYFANPYSHVKH
ncbi:MAG: hypothetical protein JSW26_10810, partial [Desulfobacterales bacterium]